MNKNRISASNEIYLEFTQIGNQMRVAAIDVNSGIEVIFITPKNTPRSQIEKLALAKLNRRIEQLNTK